MSYLAIARRWRPQEFEDVVGQTHVVRTLQNAIALDSVHHAYLFCGPRGVGKTSLARIFAKALRCPNVKDAKPCHVCEECIAIAESRSVDVAEIDGASHNGVEAVRALREGIAYAPSSGSRKIYIIDEVHMLSLSAFNALLKTLEEPPSHVVFLFATTESHKIPVTILSRCQRFDLRRLTGQQIVERLKKITDGESLKVSDEGLRALATQGDGSLRDALSLLDQVVSYAGDVAVPLSEEEISQALGIQPAGVVTEYVTAIVDKNLQGALNILERTETSGFDLQHFAERTLEEMRWLYLLTVHRETGAHLSFDDLELSPSRYERLKLASEQAKLVQVERMAQIQSKAVSQLAWSKLPRFVLEMATVRMSELDKLFAIEASYLDGSAAAADEVEPPPMPTPSRPPMRAAESAPPRPPGGVMAPPPVVAAPPSGPPPGREAPPPNLSPAGPSAGPRSAPPSPGTNAGGGGTSTPELRWKSFVEGVMRRRPLLGALLGHAEFSLKGPGEVVLRFPAESFYERQAMEQKNRTEIEQYLKEAFGPQTSLALQSVSGVPLKSLEQAQLQQNAQRRKEALEHPVVVQAKEMLGAEVIDVRLDN